MRACSMITILGMLPCILFSQTNISGVVNSYYKVLGIKYSESGLKLDNVNGLAVNDRVMVIQMKGATVNTTVTSSSFGSVSSLNQAGNYELATICAVRSDSVFLLQQLLRTYSVTDKVQLVKIPRYVSANVIGQLEPAVWDSTSGKGGVLAIIVSQTLTLNAPVSASGKGFKGGAFYKDGGGCATNAFQNYAYDPTPTTYFIYSNVQKGAWKGESISDLPITMDGGRGACANGGGGGNNHNNGGGGGSNLISGGKGGDNLSTTGCAGQQAGLGGYTLNSNSGTKIFLGGGGGAGHANNTSTSTGGGYGGGIVFIQAETLASNGFAISANGSAGGNTSGDGASGGGGGGTIILSINSYADAISIEAKGGIGGNVDDETISGRCYGEGGGGSGGVVYFSGLQPSGSVDVTGGIKGLKLNSTCASSTGTNGTTGSQVTNYQYIESTTLSGCGTSVLDVNWLYFKTSTVANTVLLHWAITSPVNPYFAVERKKEESWIEIAQVQSASSKAEYYFRDLTATSGIYQYRLKYISNQKTSYSAIRQVIVKATSNQSISYSLFTKQLLAKDVTEKNDMLRIFNAAGMCIYQKIFTSPVDEWQLNTSFLKSGLYIAKTTNAVTKFIVTDK